MDWGAITKVEKIIIVKAALYKLKKSEFFPFLHTQYWMDVPSFTVIVDFEGKLYIFVDFRWLEFQDWQATEKP